MTKRKKCKYCRKSFEGRAGKKYCNHHCKSAHHYEKRKEEDQLFFKIDRQLKINRKILKSMNRAGKAIVRRSELHKEGFNPKFFTHYWKNRKGDVYLFCYEYGFLATSDNDKPKYLLVQHQDYMNSYFTT